MFDFHRVLEELCEHRPQELEVAVEFRSLDGTRPQGHPRRARSANGHDEHASALRYLLVFLVPVVQPCRIGLLGAFRAGDQLEWEARAVFAMPHSGIAAGGLVESGENLTKLGHARTSV